MLLCLCGFVLGYWAFVLSFDEEEWLGNHLWDVPCVDFQGGVPRTGNFGDPYGNIL
jgi:hypothetical protein